jgi:putative endonuclease
LGKTLTIDGTINEMSKKNDTWHVYMLLCNDGTLYTGYTNDLEKRIKAHNSGKNGARYTRSRRPIKLVYTEQVESKSAAARLEYRIKKMRRDKKKRLIAGKSQRQENNKW